MLEGRLFYLYFFFLFYFSSWPATLRQIIYTVRAATRNNGASFCLSLYFTFMLPFLLCPSIQCKFCDCIFVVVNVVVFDVAVAGDGDDVVVVITTVPDFLLLREIVWDENWSHNFFGERDFKGGCFWLCIFF